MKDPDQLITAYLDDALNDTEREALNNWLKTDPANMRQFTEAVMFEQQIRAAAQAKTEQQAAESFTPAPVVRIVPAMFNRWFSWRPLAAGVVFGIFCASVAWAYVSPRVPKVVKQLLPLFNAGFEDGVAPSATGIPVSFGVWSGDYAEVVEAQQGIVPRENQRMFRFLRSDSAQPSSGMPPFNGNIYQAVDIRPWREGIADGKATVDWSAWFNSIQLGPGHQSQFMVGLWAFSGSPEILPRNWTENLRLEIATSSKRIIADGDSATWQRVAGSMIVPPDADFLVVELKVIPVNPLSKNGAVSFAGHYADDVTLVLRTSAQPKLPLATK